MEWEILIIGGGTLFVFIGAIVKPLLALNKTLTTLDISVNGLRDDLNGMKDDNKETHKDIYGKLDDHEHRITEIERR